MEMENLQIKWESDQLVYATFVKIFEMRVLLFFLSVISTPLNAQTVQPNLISKNEISTVAYWSIGDKKSYHLTRTRSKYKNDKKNPEETNTDQFDLQISVLDSTDSSYLMRLTYKNRQTDIDDKSKKNSLKPLEDYYIDYVTDEYGSFDSITNLNQLAELLKTHFSKSMEGLDAADSTKRMIAEIADKMFANMDILSLFFQEDIVLLHSIYGVQLKLETPIEMELEYPPMNDVQLLGEGQLTLKTIDKEHDFCRILMTQRPYKEEINGFLMELITQFLPVDFDRLELNECSFNATSKLSYTMELSSGWMRKVTNKSTVTAVVKKKKMKTVVSTVLEER